MYLTQDIAKTVRQFLPKSKQLGKVFKSEIRTDIPVKYTLYVCVFDLWLKLGVMDTSLIVELNFIYG